MSTPILSKKFFDEHAPQAGFFSKWRDRAPWAESYLPIYEWQGVLFVGCLYIPENFPKLTEQVVFVLCDQESLKTIWYDYQGTVVAKPQVPLKPAALAADTPDGLMALNIPSAPPEISMDNLASASPEAVAAEAPPSADEHSLTMDIELLNLEGDKAPPPPNLANLSSPPPSEVRATPIKSENIAVKPLGPPQPSGLQQKPLATPSAPVKGNPADHEVTNLAVQSLNVNVKNPKPELDAFIKNLYTEMAFFFQKSMILLKDGDTMKPWNWDSSFHAPTTLEPISLATPSPWRIVMKTRMPYHGHLIPNEISDKFFDSWNSSLTPEHLTLSPIVIQDHVIGMILGIGEKSADNKTSLQLTERWAREFEKQIQAQPNFVKVS